jgi:hypothetical protein
VAASPDNPARKRKPRAGEFLLLPRPFVVTGLPYKRDESVRQVTRRARLGAQTFLTVTYIATHPDYPLPFGADRSLLAWITTQAFATGAIQFSAIADYLETFQLDRGGKSYKLFRERFQRLAHLAIRIEREEGPDRTVNRLFLIPASYEPIELGRPSSTPPSRKILTYHRYGFLLDRRFHEYLREHPVPVPLKVARTFHNSPRRWDFALLVLYRSFAATKPTVIPWQALLDHLGSQARDPYRLRYQLERDLTVLQSLVDRELGRFLPGTGGLRISPSESRD